ncbi:MAG TPA: nicotinate-nucleotide adenylyltransferase [Polyangiaceae bacterium]|nr:nicotinate-nucleotide adenylyltransferase [Polyangiaceae bacterium]
MARRTLIFGGSFNPIHQGHLALARYAREKLGFDRVLFVPNGDRYPKPDLAPARDRLAMVAAAVDGERGFEVLDLEATSEVPVRTVETVGELRRRFPDDELHLLRGADALPRTHRRLFAIEGLRVLVVDRAGASALETLLSAHPHLAQHRDRIDHDAGFSHPLSASEVRRRVAAGEPLDALVPPRVAELIAARGMYRGGAAR